MRVNSLPVLRTLIAGAIIAVPAQALAEGGWAFCYVDPPTFGTGTFVYTRVFYLGGAPLPTDRVALIMVQANPQVAQRPISCWRYGSEAEAESRRQQGMNYDRGRGYSIGEVTFKSPFTYDPNAVQPVVPVADAAPQTPALTPAPAPGDRPAAEASKTAAASTSSVAPGEPKAPAQPVESAKARYERELAEHQRRMALDAQHQADYRQSLQEHQSRVADLAAQAEAARKEFEERRAKWQADVAACQAGDHSRCDNSPQ